MATDDRNDRLELARAVRLVGRAKGRQETRQRLLELAAQAQEWADRLADSGEDYPHQERAA